MTYVENTVASGLLRQFILSIGFNKRRSQFKVNRQEKVL